MQNIHFIGIGGIGMSALANLLLAKGKNISGSDKEESDITSDLTHNGARLFYKHNAQNIPQDCDTVIFSEAIPQSNPERLEAEKRGIKQLTYAQALGKFSKKYKLVLVTGTHGKTTITGMIAHICIEAGLDPTIVIGSKMQELQGKNYRVGKSELCIIEGCEYRRSFLNFEPDILVISNIDIDHLDYYKDKEDYISAFKELIAQMPRTASIVINEEDPSSIEAVKERKSKLVSFNANELANLVKEEKLRLKIPGEHNRLNAVHALKVAQILKVPEEKALASLNTFPGTWRRLEFIAEKHNVKVYDDYGQHPTEIKATLQALREIYPEERVCCVFQPHQFNRTKHFLSDFASSFTQADTVIIPNIYKVRDAKEDQEAVSAQMLVDKIKEYHHDVVHGQDLKNTLKYLHENLSKWDVIILMGAGDITKIRNRILL